MHVSFLTLSTPASINVKEHARQLEKAGRLVLGAFLATALFTLCMSSPVRAQDVPTPKLMIKDHVFTPDTLEVPVNKRFQIEVENLDKTPAEFESSDLRVEKFVVGGGKIVVRISPLKPGTYKFFDDYHPDTAKGTITAK
jgi:hypothetical protein